MYLAGVRLHEWHLGATILVSLLIGAVTDLVDLTLGSSVLVAAINLVSTLTPNVSWRGHALLHIEPVAALRASHALAIPASAVLLVTALYLQRRRRHALYLALALLVALGVLNLLKGLDFEEAILDFGAAGLLWVGRGSFFVRHDPLTLRSALWRVPTLVLGCVLTAGLSVLVAAPAGTSFSTVAEETGDLLIWQQGPLAFHDESHRRESPPVPANPQGREPAQPCPGTGVGTDGD